MLLHFSLKLMKQAFEKEKAKVSQCNKVDITKSMLLALTIDHFHHDMKHTFVEAPRFVVRIG